MIKCFQVFFVEISGAVAKSKALLRTCRTLLRTDRALWWKYWARLRKNGLFCGHTWLFCERTGLFCEHTGLFCTAKTKAEGCCGMNTISVFLCLSLSLEERLCFLMEIHGIFAEKCCGRNAISLSLFLSLSLSERAIMLLDANTRHFCGKMLW